MDSKKSILIYYIIVIFFIGIPIWYKTTSPTRYKLPDVKSLMVHSQRIISKIKINIIDVNSTNQIDEKSYDEFKEELDNNWLRYDSQSKGIIYEFQWIVRKLKDDIEDKLFDKKIESLIDVDELSKELKVRFKQGNLSIYLLDNNEWIRLTNKLDLKNLNFIFGSYRSIYVKKSYVTSDKIARLIHRILDNELENDLNSELLEAKIPKNIELSLMNLKLTIYLNIITEELNDSIKFQESDNFQILNKMRLKFLDELIGTDFNIKIISQMINNAFPDDLIENNLIDLKEKNRYFNLNFAPELLYRIETRISPPSDKHTVEFNIILPSSKKSNKLYFYDKLTKQKSNAIVTPYQSNTLIWNDLNDFNIGFKSFIRKQFGLPFKQPKEALKRDIFFAKWEFDNLIRQITVKQLAKTLESLESLEKLLNKISNIVIEKKISKQMFDAVDYAHKAIDELENYGLNKAFKFSSKAFSNSENAYYDPSLLSLLYFPGKYFI